MVLPCRHLRSPRCLRPDQELLLRKAGGVLAPLVPTQPILESQWNEAIVGGKGRVLWCVWLLPVPLGHQEAAELWVTLELLVVVVEEDGGPRSEFWEFSPELVELLEKERLAILRAANAQSTQSETQGEKREGGGMCVSVGCVLCMHVCVGMRVGGGRRERAEGALPRR